jgi:DNA-binding Lrp family transcriptional regulator
VLILSEKAVLTGKTAKVLRLLFDRGKTAHSYIAEVNQNQLADELKVTRQALNVHLRKLRSCGFIRTGRGFVEITDSGLKALGLATDLAFVFLKISPHKRIEAYKKITTLPVRHVFRVAGEMDLVFTVETDKLDTILHNIAQMSGIEKTLSFITIESLR